MIREFLYKYYIDPIRYGQAYTLVDTLTYALILIVAVYVVYRGLQRYKIVIDDELVLATLPFVVLGGLLRVVEDTGMVTSDLRFLLITPLIFFTIFVVAAVALFVGKLAANARLVTRYSRVYAGVGIVACIATGAVLIWFGLAETRIALDVLIAILARIGLIARPLGSPRLRREVGLRLKHPLQTPHIRPYAGRERNRLRHRYPSYPLCGAACRGLKPDRGDRNRVFDVSPQDRGPNPRHLYP